MKRGELRRQELLEHLADHLLAQGLQGASLRPLAAAVGTSDRMLLHYFSDKEELLSATLNLITRRLLVILDAARTAPMPFHTLLPLLTGMVKSPEIQPYLRLWLELLPLAAAGQEPFRSIALRISTAFRSWIAAALQVDSESERDPLAALTLMLIEGVVMFDALGDDTTPAAALEGIALIVNTARAQASPDTSQ